MAGVIVMTAETNYSEFVTGLLPDTARLRSWDLCDAVRLWVLSDKVVRIISEKKTKMCLDSATQWISKVERSKFKSKIPKPFLAVTSSERLLFYPVLEVEKLKGQGQCQKWKNG